MKLLIADGSSLVRQIYEAVPGPDSLDRARVAQRSARASFARALDEHAPTHAIAPFDFGGHTWRHALYPQYRAKRKPMPEPLREVLPDIRQDIEALGIATLATPGAEGDDLVGTIFHRWSEFCRGPVVILSGDKDIAILAAHGAVVRHHFQRAARDNEWCMARYGIPISALADYLALLGDDVDGVPGVPGIGDKTAKKWMNRYGSIERLLQDRNNLPGHAGRQLRAHIDQLELSRQLIALKTDIDCGLTWKQIRVG
ncbi:5'-3' exonuclease [Burkholderia sp. MBR-1]|uniref:5'-3' exonuclease n=1 Tax=Burkholderia sp. MBR-1 TaxID=2732364 RepID=UPI0015EE97C1|nr:5'-3' exonuclease H3TH domain-containing protein [Burkholderia sp. MBR-1]QMI49973.1 5'-3' exonuclease [Burkholderia sp. MBR-1]